MRVKASNGKAAKKSGDELAAVIGSLFRRALQLWGPNDKDE
jgi:hypothetical protein